MADPDPMPAFAAVNMLPTMYVTPVVPAAKFQFVVPRVRITYRLPGTNVPAVNEATYAIWLYESTA